MHRSWRLISGLLLLVSCGHDSPAGPSTPDKEPPPPEVASTRSANLAVSLEDMRTRLLLGLGEVAARDIGERLRQARAHLASGDRGQARQALLLAETALRDLSLDSASQSGSDPNVATVELVLGYADVLLRESSKAPASD